MKTRTHFSLLTLRPAWLVVLWIVVLAIGTSRSAGAATLADFGYLHMQVNGRLALGVRPMVVILVEFGGPPVMAHTPSYYSNLVFNATQSRSLLGYFQENSNDRFSWSRGGSGVVGPLQYPQADRSLESPTDHPKGIARIVTAAMQTGFNFAQFDANDDGVVTQEELGVLIFSNYGERNGATRWANPSGANTPTNIPGSPVALRVKVCGVEHQVNFATLVHETSHLLETVDLYGRNCASPQATLMSCTLGHPADSPIVYHLDPWHKMQLGWSQPRLRSLAAGGTLSVQAAQLRDPYAPVLLHDPARGVEEFFILEYRTPASPAGPGYDENVVDAGLAVWHVQQDGNHNAVVLQGITAGPYPGQPHWSYCGKCLALHFITDDADPVFGPCPAGGNHARSSATDYVLVNNNPDAPGQPNWRWCQKCQGLFYGPNQAGSHCPAGGAHDGSVSGNYRVMQNDPDPRGQAGWGWCSKCQGLFFGTSGGNCPAGGGHDGAQSGDYIVGVHFEGRCVLIDGEPDHRHGMSRFWPGGAVTPYLRWFSGTETRTRLHVRPFNPGDGVIAVEWLTETEMWVDFGYPGPPEYGTFSEPFNTLAEGVSAVPYGGTIQIKTGTTSERPTLSKRMTLRSYGGPATIGRP